MTIPASHRPAREWLLLILALLIVGGVVAPLWQFLGGIETREQLAARWTPERLTQLFLGPEQVACYVCFVWATLILQSRYREVVRQRAAFRMELLPTEEGARILPEDARPLARKVETATAQAAVHPREHDPARARASTRSRRPRRTWPRSSAIRPTWNCRGWSRAWRPCSTSRGRSPRSASSARSAGSAARSAPMRRRIEAFTAQAKDQLKIAFDCTLVALVLSLVLMYLLNMVQRAEETLVVDAQEYCQEHLLLRLYDPSAESVSS